MNTYGTNNAISALGDASVTDAAISVANWIASSRVCGFNFQFPEMNGRRAAASDNSVLDVVEVVVLQLPRLFLVQQCDVEDGWKD